MYNAVAQQAFGTLGMSQTHFEVYVRYSTEEADCRYNMLVGAASAANMEELEREICGWPLALAIVDPNFERVVY